MRFLYHLIEIIGSMLLYAVTFTSPVLSFLAIIVSIFIYILSSYIKEGRDSSKSAAFYAFIICLCLIVLSVLSLFLPSASNETLSFVVFSVSVAFFTAVTVFVAWLIKRKTKKD